MTIPSAGRFCNSTRHWRRNSVMFRSRTITVYTEMYSPINVRHPGRRGGLQIAAGLALGKTMVEEMMAMEVKVSAAGNEQYAAWREGPHDDLVFAAALAYWSAQKVYSPGPVHDSQRCG